MKNSYNVKYGEKPELPISPPPYIPSIPLFLPKLII